MSIWRTSVVKQIKNSAKVSKDLRNVPAVNSNPQKLKQLVSDGANCGNCNHCAMKSFSVRCNLKQKYLISKFNICTDWSKS